MGPQTRVFKSEQLSDLGSQVWTAVRLRIPGPRNPRSEIFKKLFLDPGLKTWIQMVLLIQVWKSWILDLDPRFLPWIQEKFFDNLGSWVLTMSDLRFSSPELFSYLRFLSHRNWNKINKQSMNFRPKHSLESFGVCLLWLYRGFVAMHIHIL